MSWLSQSLLHPKYPLGILLMSRHYLGWSLGFYFSNQLLAPGAVRGLAQHPSCISPGQRRTTGINSKGYECTRIFTAALRTGWKGLRTYKALVALNRKMVLPLFSTMKVCRQRETAVISEPQVEAKGQGSRKGSETPCLGRE